QQFLYFLPLLHGQGSLRPTLSLRLRIGSGFLSPCWLPAMAASCWLRMLSADGLGADSCTVVCMAQSDSWKSISSSRRNRESVTLSCTPSHMVSNSFMPWRLYSVFGSTWA